MIVCGLLCWYDESPADLERAISSAARAGTSRLVALDGSYSMYPGGEAQSPIEQLEAIETACESAGVQLDYERPVMRWPSEMHKRSHLFAMADRFTADVADRDAWYLILDADYEIQSLKPIPEIKALAGHAPAADARMYLPTSERLAKSHFQQETKIRTLFRGRGISVEGNHYTYRLPDGTKLWAGPAEAQTKAVDVSHLVTVIHWTFQRDAERLGAQEAYYRARDEEGVERGPCDICRIETSVCFLPIGASGYARPDSPADWSFVYAEVCRNCLPILAAENVKAADRLGLDPSGLNQPLNVVRGAL